MVAKIYKPAKTAMSSGTARTRRWVLEFEPEEPRTIEPLMGYTSSRDMKSQIRLEFDSEEEAVAYAKRNGMAYQVAEAREQRRRPIAYADNFRYNRKTPWSH